MIAVTREKQLSWSKSSITLCMIQMYALTRALDRLKQFLIRRRNQRVTGSLKRTYGDQTRVFCVSNTLYSNHRVQEPDRANEYIELSGIRRLRRVCQSVPADAQLRTTEEFLQTQVPALLGSVSLWATAGSDTVTNTRAEVLRGVLSDAEQVLHQVR
jgi:hypothetical protein